jgi:putative nucleotidyltransferase with HDIG domain
LEKIHSCVITRAVLSYISSRCPERLDTLVRNVHPELDILPDPGAYLMDINNWVSSEVCAEMFRRAEDIFGDPRVAIRIGYDSMVNMRRDHIQKILIRFFGSPQMILTRLQKMNDKWNRNKTVELVERGRNHAVIRLHWFQETHPAKSFCYYFQGVVQAVPTLWKMAPAQLEETACFFDGSEYCEYRMRWRNRPYLFHFASNLVMRRKLLEETIEEIERGKQLLQHKYDEIHRLNIQLEKKVIQLSSIQEASQAVVSILDLTTILEVAFSLLARLFGFDRLVIFSIDEDRRILSMLHATGSGGDLIEKIRDYKVPLTRLSNILARVASTGVPAIIEDVEKSSLNKENLIIKLFQPKAFVVIPLIAKNKIVGVLAADKRDEKLAVSQEDKDYIVSFANNIAIAIENARLYLDLKKNFFNSIQALAYALEAKDPYTRGHSEVVAQYSIKIARELGLPEERIEPLRQTCLLHDIGKIGLVPDILGKHGIPNKEEWQLVRKHPIIGDNIVRPLNLPSDIRSVIRNHHERFDGRGYPDGLMGTQIPLEARIVAVADAYDAMVSTRPYRKAMSSEKALLELDKNAGTQFDPDVVRVFRSVIRVESIN